MITRSQLHCGLLTGIGTTLLAWVLFDAGSLARALGPHAAVHEAVVALIALLLVGLAYGAAVLVGIRSSLHAAPPRVGASDRPDAH